MLFRNAKALLTFYSNYSISVSSYYNLHDNYFNLQLKTFHDDTTDFEEHIYLESSHYEFDLFMSMLVRKDGHILLIQ